MEDHIYKRIEGVGTSTTTMEDAIRNAIGKASESVKHLRWFEVIETRGDISEGKPHHWQITLKIGFTIE